MKANTFLIEDKNTFKKVLKLDQIINYIYRLHKKVILDNNFKTEVTSKHLYKYYKNSTKFILQQLIDEKLISCCESYASFKEKGKIWCKSYALTKKGLQFYHDNKILVENSKFYQKLEKKDINFKKNIISDKNILQEIYKTLQNLNVNIEDAQKDLKILENSTKNIKEKNNICLRLKALQNISNKQLFFTQSKEHRLYTSLTNLKREDRKYIYFDNKKEKQISFDISNSQPALLMLLFNQDFIKQTKISKYIKKYKLNKAIQQIQLINTKNINTVIQSSIDGQFYELLLNKFKLFYKTQKVERQEFKQLILQYFYRNTKLKINSVKLKALDEMFKTCFKEIYDAINLLKAVDYKSLSKLLQRIEAYIFIENIAFDLITKYKFTKFYTIHDSICSTIENESLIKKVIDEVKIKLNLNLNFKKD